MIKATHLAEELRVKIDIDRISPHFPLRDRVKQPGTFFVGQPFNLLPKKKKKKIGARNLNQPEKQDAGLRVIRLVLLKITWLARIIRLCNVGGWLRRVVRDTQLQKGTADEALELNDVTLPWSQIVDSKQIPTKASRVREVSECRRRSESMALDGRAAQFCSGKNDPAVQQ
jgi:hypothetical protein